MPFRTCRICGLEANTEEELKQFHTGKDSKHGRTQVCLQCHSNANKQWYHDLSPERKNAWNQRIIDVRGPTFSFKGKTIRTKENPRTNICHECGKTHPEHLKKQTALHHIIYLDEDPLAWTVELCGSCHMKLHALLRKHA